MTLLKDLGLLKLFRLICFIYQQTKSLKRLKDIKLLKKIRKMVLKWRTFCRM